MTSIEPLGNLGSVPTLLLGTLYSGNHDIGTTSSRILYQQSDIYYICWCPLNVATYGNLLDRYFSDRYVVMSKFICKYGRKMNEIFEL